MARWTRLVLRFRWPIVAFWLAVLLVGGYAASRLSPLLSNTFTVRGTDYEGARTILQDHFGDRSDGEFLVIYKIRDGNAAAVLPALERSLRNGAVGVPNARPTALRGATCRLVDGSIPPSLTLADAKGSTDGILRRLRPPPGVNAYVSGQAAIQHDLDPIFSRDLRKGESIALPIALLVLLSVFGLSFATTMPFLFAAVTITGTLSVVYIAAHYMVMATYVTNLVQLIGLGIAIDYSLLVVYRFREELARGRATREACLGTMQTAGRAVICSGATVAIGLALLLFMPLPFMRSMGVGGFLIPLVSIAAAATLQPVLLSLYGRRGTARVHVADWVRRQGIPLPHLAGPDDEHGMWARLAQAIMRRPLVFLVSGITVLVAVAIPAFGLQLTPGSAQGIPQTPQSGRGLPEALVRRLPVARRRGPDPDLPPADAGVPLAALAAEGGPPQPALGRGELRHARRRVPVGRRRLGRRPLPVPTGRRLDPHLPVRDALRPVDGLRGLPRHADARDVGRGARQCPRRFVRVGADRLHHHGGRDHHGRGVLRVRRGLDRRVARVRARPRGRDLRRCDDRAGAACSRVDGGVRTLELVAAAARGPCASLRTLAARAPSRAAAGRPLTSRACSARVAPTPARPAGTATASRRGRMSAGSSGAAIHGISTSSGSGRALSSRRVTIASRAARRRWSTTNAPGGWLRSAPPASSSGFRTSSSIAPTWTRPRSWFSATRGRRTRRSTPSSSRCSPWAAGPTSW